MTVDQWIGVALLGWACGVVTRDILMAWAAGRPKPRRENRELLTTDTAPAPAAFAIRYPTAEDFSPKRGGDSPPSSPPRAPLPRTRCD